MKPCRCHGACAYGIGLEPDEFCRERVPAEQVDHPPIVWFDLETTGLDPDFDQILEVACVITNAELEVLCTYTAVVAHREVVTMRSVVLEMHSKSGLRDAVYGPHAKPMSQIENELIALFVRNGVTDSSPLAGSTIHFDRSFLKRDMPTVLAMLHYRNVDVSSMRELIKRWRPDDLYQKGDRHRALPDALDSIQQLRHYRRVFGL